MMMDTDANNEVQHISCGLSQFMVKNENNYGDKMTMTDTGCTVSKQSKSTEKIRDSVNTVPVDNIDDNYSLICAGKLDDIIERQQSTYASNANMSTMSENYDSVCDLNYNNTNNIDYSYDCSISAMSASVICTNNSINDANVSYSNDYNNSIITSNSCRSGAMSRNIASHSNSGNLACYDYANMTNWEPKQLQPNTNAVHVASGVATYSNNNNNNNNNNNDNNINGCNWSIGESGARSGINTCRSSNVMNNNSNGNNINASNSYNNNNSNNNDTINNIDDLTALEPSKSAVSNDSLQLSTSCGSYWNSNVCYNNNNNNNGNISKNININSNLYASHYHYLHQNTYNNNNNDNNNNNNNNNNSNNNWCFDGISRRVNGVQSQAINMSMNVNYYGNCGYNNNINNANNSVQQQQPQGLARKQWNETNNNYCNCCSCNYNVCKNQINTALPLPPGPPPLPPPLPPLPPLSSKNGFGNNYCNYSNKRSTDINIINNNNNNSNINHFGCHVSGRRRQRCSCMNCANMDGISSM